MKSRSSSYIAVLEFNDELAVLGYDVQDYAIILGRSF